MLVQRCTVPWRSVASQAKTWTPLGSATARLAREVSVTAQAVAAKRTDQALEQIRGLLEQSCSQTLSGVLSGAEPLLSGVMLLVAALSLVSVMLPLIGMMGTIG